MLNIITLRNNLFTGGYLFDWNESINEMDSVSNTSLDSGFEPEWEDIYNHKTDYALTQLHTLNYFMNLPEKIVERLEDEKRKRIANVRQRFVDNLILNENDKDQCLELANYIFTELCNTDWKQRRDINKLLKMSSDRK